MIGHNGGPSIEAGYGFRKHAWGKAREALLPKLPIEIVRVRVARARRLGLPYRTYAGIRAATGRDVVAFLFSGNALELTARRIEMPAQVAARLVGLHGAAARLGAVYAPLDPGAVQAVNSGALDAAHRAPGFAAPWAELRSDVKAMLAGAALPADGVVLVAATTVEREWTEAAQLAGTIRAAQFFAPPA